MVTLFAMLIAMPIGLMSAIYLSEYASPRMRAVLKPTLELLAGIPTIIYGYFALTFITPEIIQDGSLPANQHLQRAGRVDRRRHHDRSAGCIAL